MATQKICILGGSGFVGSHLTARLVEQGKQVTIATRRRERAKHLLPLPGVEVVEADIHDPQALKSLFAGQDAVINLVGILHGNRKAYEHNHAELPRKIVSACHAAGIFRLLHMSALGADVNSPSLYQRTKADGEAIVRAAEKTHHLHTTIFRPSVIFGPGDSFLNLFARLLKLAPIVPLASGNTRFQPVYVGDVVRAFAQSLDDPATYGQTYSLCGPQVYSLAELVQLTARTLGLKRSVIPLGQPASYLFAALMELKPGRKLMTRDNYYAALKDNVCPEGFPTLFGSATPLEAVIGYLKQADPRCQYGRFRQLARR
ncbi:NADH dehydrogenase [Sulfuritortus calidifontis]|uniref:NADH dehydrogenase n=1 Tax=Sulfuritortus calidifontis TaxID=1914471 RepID=A0A4R3JUV4_9PROT|nr:complex I NDUFA9 subunit family protein [Sulfuritortus calidifontis]TCS69997.1 NADH dehydrogenase [Sulfuritortus calidifontis]